MRRFALISKHLWLCPVLLVHAQAFAFGIEDLRALVRENDLTMVEEVIERLPQEYKKNFTLAYDSQSLQGSSYENPRAILFGRNARFVLSFNGDPTQQHYNTIEAIQFREGIESFELYSIKFESGDVNFSEPNPAVCTSCHGSPAHPVWSSYEYDKHEARHWPGMYGSTHDTPGLDETEKAAFKRFRDHAASHPRYRHLVLSEAEAHWYPYTAGHHQHRLRPNNRLGNLLARWRARQIAALIRRGDFIENHPHVAQAWLLRCPGTEERAYRGQIKALFDAKLPSQRYAYIHAIRDSLPPDQQTAFMMERLLTGSDNIGWDMSVEIREEPGRFFTGIVDIDRLVGARWMATLDEDHELRAYYEPWTNRQLYNTFTNGYYDSNVAPGGVGESYDQITLDYNDSRANQACAELMRDALSRSARSRK